MTTIDSIRVDLEALTGRFFDQFNSATRRMEKFSADLSRVATRVGRQMTASVTAPLAAVGGAALLAGQRIEGLERRIRVSTGASGAVLDQLGNDFRSLARELPSSLSSIADVVGSLNTQTGAAGESLRELGRITLEASRLLGDDAATNATRLGQTIVKFGLDAEQGADAMATLFDASQRYNISVGDQLTQLNAYGDILANAGLEVREIVDLFGRLNLAGTQITRVMPGINAATRRFAAEGIDLRRGLEDVVARVRDAETSIEALNIATETFGAEGAQRLTVAIRNGAFTLDGLGRSLNMSAADVLALAEETNTLRDELSRLANRGVLALEPLGDAIASIIRGNRPVIERFASAVEDLGERFGNMTPIAQGAVITVGALAAAAGPALIGLGFIAQGMGAVVTATKLATVAMTGFIGKAALIAALPAAGLGLGVALSTEFEAVKRIGVELVFGVELLTTDLARAIVDGSRWLATTAASAISGLGRGVVDLLTDVNLGVVDTITSMQSAILGKASEFVDMVAGVYRDIGKRLAGVPFLSSFAGAAIGASSGLSAVGDAIDAARGSLDRGADGYISTVESIRDRIAGVISGAEGTFVGAVDGLASGLGAGIDRNIAQIEEELILALDEVTAEFAQARGFGERFGDQLEIFAGPAIERARELASQLAERLGFVSDNSDGAADAIGQMNLALAELGELASGAANLDRLAGDIESVGDATDSTASNMEAAFDSAARGMGRALSDFVTKGTADLTRLAESIFDTLIQATLIEGVLNPLLDKFFEGGDSGGGGLLGALFSAKGNAFSGGRVLPFASGGVISSPIAFPLAGNTVGVAGEAGPEAILPLERGPGGDLGVKASMGGGVVVNVIDQRSGGDPVGVSESTGPDGSRQITVLVRDAMRENFANGSLDREMSNSYGIRRKGRAP